MKDITPERLGALVQDFCQIFLATSEDLPIPERARLAMLGVPDEVAREIGDLAAGLAELAAARSREEQIA
jgi:hypothetical protein